jgi:hypothetical protein
MRRFSAVMRYPHIFKLMTMMLSNTPSSSATSNVGTILLFFHNGITTKISGGRGFPMRLIADAPGPSAATPGYASFSFIFKSKFTR